MFGRRRKREDDLAKVRDVVEIVAIVAAGVWAFYTFVYQNDIKPANSPTQTQVQATLNRLGERKGLIAIESHVVVTDAGITDVNIYGIAETIAGRVVRPHAAIATLAPVAPGGSEVLEPVSQEDARTFLFGFASLTRLAQPASHDQIDLRPGQSLPVDQVFYVPAGKFDKLELHLSMRFSAHPTPLPYRVVHDGGIIRIEAPGGVDTDGVDGIDGWPATLSLW